MAAQPAALTAGLVAKGHAPRPADPIPVPPAQPAPVQVKSPVEPNEPMNFKMPPAFRYEFKLAALQAGKQMNELLVDCFAAWKRERDRAGEGA